MPNFRRQLFLLAAVLLSSACATDARLARLEEASAMQVRLLAEHNVMLNQQAELMAQLIEAQQQQREAISGLDSALQRERARLEKVVHKLDPESDTPEPETVPVQVVDHEGKAVVGRNEWAWFDLLGRNLKARVDTGALTSSLNAIDLQPFERDGRRWIRFRVPDQEHPDGGDVYETRLVRYVRIKQASADGMDRRPVVKLLVRVGELVDETEFTLNNREDMLYPVLLGRSFLRDVAIVDVSRVFVQPKFRPEESPPAVPEAEADAAPGNGDEATESAE